MPFNSQNPLNTFSTHIALVVAVVLTFLAGCAGRPSLFPNSNPDLRRTSAQFAADAAKRTYRADAEPGTIKARAAIEYGIKEVQLVNLSDEEWTNVEVWVNERYVCFVPKITPKKLQRINFQMLY